MDSHDDGGGRGEGKENIRKFLCIIRFKELMSALHTGKNSWPV